MTSPIVIAGGGTGGHVFVAEAVARALIEQGERPESLEFVGSKRGQERTLLANSGIALTLLPGRGLRRSFRPKAIVQNAGALLGLALGIIEMLLRFAKNRPRVVVSVGGYGALAPGIAAGLWRRPLVLVNIDASPGSTHRFLNRFTTASCVITPSTPLRNPTVTGAPVRPELQSLSRSLEDRRAARLRLGCDPDLPFVAVTTGSLGAHSVNEAVRALGALWSSQAITIYHVTGRRDFAEMSSDVPENGLAGAYRLVAFQENMADLYQASDVLICRAGALTVAEITVSGLCAVLIPLPGAPGDHQTKNAQALVDHQAGIMLRDGDLNGATLSATLERLLNDKDRRATMEQAARQLGHPDAANEVASVVLSHG